MKMGVELDNLEDMFETFIAQTNIRYTYYNETQKILGSTYGMLVLQDFEAITPNILARTIETIEGGGIVCILLNTIDSVKQLYTMTMDVHSRFRTESHHDVVPRFNERFILSLSACKKCVIVDDKLNILPISSSIASIKPVPKSETSELSAEEVELVAMKKSLADTQPVGSIINLCKTLDQAKAVLKFIDAISEKTLSATVTLTASRGRGKSAALGLAIAAAIAFNYSNIYITSPSPENLKTLFEFILKGFDAIALKEHYDYDVIQSTNAEFNKAVVRVNVFREHRQSIQYIHPADALKNKFLAQSAELMVIDEAAAIPLPIVRSLIGPYLVFMSSTINGYEGTGRSLSLKLIQQLRQQSVPGGGGADKIGDLHGRSLCELQLNESIRYKKDDDIEQWLNGLLCLDASLVEPPPSVGCPVPSDCNLYYINRDTLFSFHKGSENFLQRIMALYVASHYKNSPNDLQMMSDAPACHLFCLLPPINASQGGKIPDVLCFIQVALEGEISQDSIMASLSRGKRGAGDLIPWTISQQFQDSHFASLSGARIVRIATNPNFQGMGYGVRALQLLEDYYKGLYNIDIVNLAPKVEQSSDSPKQPLLLKLSERKAEKLNYLGVSYGLTPELLKFWKRSGFSPVYLRQTANDITGEHSCIMLKVLNANEEIKNGDDDNALMDSTEIYNANITKTNDWLAQFWTDFQRRFISLLSYQFRTFSPIFCLNVLQNSTAKSNTSELTVDELMLHLTIYDLKRLELYSQNLVDYHLIVDLLPSIVRLYFMGKFGPTFHMSHTANAILLAMGLQHKDVDLVAEELNLPSNQVLGLFSRSIKKISNYFRSLQEKKLEGNFALKDIGQTKLNPLKQSLEEELEEAAEAIKATEQKQKKAFAKDLTQYAIKGNEDDWGKALKSSQKSLVSIKRFVGHFVLLTKLIVVVSFSIAKRPHSEGGDNNKPQQHDGRKKMKNNNHNKKGKKFFKKN